MVEYATCSWEIKMRCMVDCRMNSVWAVMKLAWSSSYSLPFSTGRYSPHTMLWSSLFADSKMPSIEQKVKSIMMHFWKAAENRILQTLVANSFFKWLGLILYTCWISSFAFIMLNHDQNINVNEAVNKKRSSWVLCDSPSNFCRQGCDYWHFFICGLYA